MYFKNGGLCPTCGGEPKGSSDWIPGVALMSRDPKTGAYDYDGETDVCWDGQETQKDADGRMLLFCGHCGEDYPVEEVEASDPTERLVDVSAYCEDEAGGSDAAYTLCLEAATPETVASILRDVLSDDWGLTNAKGAVTLHLSITRTAVPS